MPGRRACAPRGWSRTPHLLRLAPEGWRGDHPPQAALRIGPSDEYRSDCSVIDSGSPPDLLWLWPTRGSPCRHHRPQQVLEVLRQLTQNANPSPRWARHYTARSEPILTELIRFSSLRPGDQPVRPGSSVSPCSSSPAAPFRRLVRDKLEGPRLPIRPGRAVVVAVHSAGRIAPPPVQLLPRSIAVFQRLRALRKLMRARIRQGPLVQIDETSVQVMGEPGRPVVDCQHHPSHPGKIPSDVLRDYKGFIQTDGYDGCDELGGQPGRSPGTSAAPMRRWPESMRSSGSNGLCESQVPPSTTPG